MLILSLLLADEGMWMPEQLPEMADTLNEMGLEIPAEQLADTSAQPLGSIVSLGGYCSASFLSPDGLIGTNHHCVSGLLQVNSTAENNVGETGYLAATRADELSGGPGARVFVVEAIEDVTEAVNAKVRKWTKDGKRYELVERAKKELIAECETQPNRRCQVSPYYGGQEFRLITKLEIQDIRIVYAPPDSVGNYGDEIDNWMWPRHSGDFALLRAYVASDGSSAPYAEDNVPYQPPSHLKVSAEGVQDGDFVMVAGYPGGTYRYRTSRNLRFAHEVRYPEYIDFIGTAKGLMEAESARDPEAAARLAAPIGWMGNSTKYFTGNLENFETTDVVQRKEADWAETMAWVESDRVNTKIYGPVFEELDELDAESERDFKRSMYTESALWMSSLLSVAHDGYRFAVEREKPDLERDRGFQDRDAERHKAGLERMEDSLWVPADRQLLELVLTRHKALPPEQQAAPLTAWMETHGGLEGSLTALYDEPSLATLEGRMATLEMDREAYESSDDPWLSLAVAFESYLSEKRVRDEERKGAMLRLMPLYMDALKASREYVYPDANNTLRVTVGHVKGYSPRDAVWYRPHTTVAGMVAKAGEDPFDAPERFVAEAPNTKDSSYFDENLGDVPVNFLSTLDSTGGNSGSATLNSKGELVGFLFDGNYEAMSADWLFDPVLTRSIHVDARYMLWLLEVEGADHLLTELGVTE